MLPHCLAPDILPPSPTAKWRLMLNPAAQCQPLCPRYAKDVPILFAMYFPPITMPTGTSGTVVIKNGNNASAPANCTQTAIPAASTSGWPNADLTLSLRFQLWPDIESTLGQRLVFAGIGICVHKLGRTQALGEGGGWLWLVNGWGWWLIGVWRLACLSVLAQCLFNLVSRMHLYLPQNSYFI